VPPWFGSAARSRVAGPALTDGGTVGSVVRIFARSNSSESGYVFLLRKRDKAAIARRVLYNIKVFIQKKTKEIDPFKRYNKQKKRKKIMVTKLMRN
jgi:hypothetical protein